MVLRFGWFYGPGATHSEQFFAMARRHICVQMGRPGIYVSSIHVADAGTAVEAALRVAPRTYDPRPPLGAGRVAGHGRCARDPLTLQRFSPRRTGRFPDSWDGISVETGGRDR